MRSRLTFVCLSPSTVHVEIRVKTGLGMCARCKVVGRYVCRGGPVFTVAELNGLSQEH